MQKLLTGAIGAAGITAVSAVGQILPDTTTVEGITQLVVQIVIGIVTLFGLFKKKK